MTFRYRGDPSVDWWGATAPATFVALGAASFIGVDFFTTVPGRLFGFRAFLPGSYAGVNYALFWTTSQNTILAAKAFNDAPPATNAWQQAWLKPSVRLTVGVGYRLGIMFTTGYQRTLNALTSPVTHNTIQFTNGWQSTAIAPMFATITSNHNANGVDILFDKD